MSNKFSRDNLEKEVYYTKFNGKKKLIVEDGLGVILEFGAVISAICWCLLYLIIPDFNPTLFIVGLFSLIVLSIISFYFVFIKFYTIKINPYSFKVEHLKEPVKFVFVSDLHIGDERVSTNKVRANLIVNMINKLNPELVILGGDFVNMDYSRETLSVLKKIKAKHKIGVYGNHDSYYLKDSQQDEFPEVGIETIQSMDIELLNNESKFIDLENNKILFGGITDLASLNFNVEETFNNKGHNSPRILIAHNPDIVDFISEDDDIDVILSGHTHGGQIVLPVIGPIYPVPVKNKQLLKGIFKVNSKTNLFVSQGVGHSGTRIRVGTENEICLITLHP